MTPHSTGRRWTLKEQMLATVLLALGFAWVRWAMDELHASKVGAYAPERIPYEPVIWKYGGAYGVVAATALLVFYRLRRPRPSWRRLARQPGMMACAAVALCLAMNLAWTARSEMISWYRYHTEEGAGWGVRVSLARLICWDWLRGIHENEMAPAVAAAWLALAGSGRWRWGRDGYDRLGVLLGAAWIVWAFISAWT